MHTHMRGLAHALTLVHMHRLALIYTHGHDVTLVYVHRLTHLCTRTGMLSHSHGA